LIRGVEEEGWRFVAFVRLVPLFPFNLVNYAFGVTRIGLGEYAIASFVCMSPGAVAYQVALAKVGIFFLPASGQPRDVGRRQAGSVRAQQRFEGGAEITGRESAQVQDRQHLADLR
jgi:hypothetical protein